jgi:hypothetical protein
MLYASLLSKGVCFYIQKHSFYSQYARKNKAQTGYRGRAARQARSCAAELAQSREP